MKSKKLLLGSLSTMALVATPIAAVVSCGGNESDAAAEKFVVSNFVKEIKANDGGLTLSIPGETGLFYISKEDAEKGGTIETVSGSKIKFSKITVKTGTVKVERTMSDNLFEMNKKNDANLKQTTTVDATVGTVTAGQYLVGNRQVVADLAAASKMVAMALTTVDGAGAYKFDFTAESLKTNTPVLTDASKKAFEKLFDDAGFTVSKITFEKATNNNVDTITLKTFELTKKADASKTTPDAKDTASVAKDLTDLQTALGGATIQLTGAGAVAVVAKADVKAAGTAMTSADLITALNGKVGAASFAPVNITDALVKKDMHIEFEVKTASVVGVPAGNGGTPAAVTAVSGVVEITISAGSLTPVRIVVTLVA